MYKEKLQIKNKKNYLKIFNIIILTFYISYLLSLIFPYPLFFIFDIISGGLCDVIIKLSSIPYYVLLLLIIIDIFVFIKVKDYEMKSRIIKVPLYLLFICTMLFKLPMNYLVDEESQRLDNYYYSNMLYNYTFVCNEGNCGVSREDVDMYFYNPFTKNIHYLKDEFKPHKLITYKNHAYVDYKKYIISDDFYVWS